MWLSTRPHEWRRPPAIRILTSGFDESHPFARMRGPDRSPLGARPGAARGPQTPSSLHPPRRRWLRRRASYTRCDPEGSRRGDRVRFPPSVFWWALPSTGLRNKATPANGSFPPDRSPIFSEEKPVRRSKPRSLRFSDGREPTDETPCRKQRTMGEFSRSVSSFRDHRALCARVCPPRGRSLPATKGSWEVGGTLNARSPCEVDYWTVPALGDSQRRSPTGPGTQDTRLPR